MKYNRDKYLYYAIHYHYHYYHHYHCHCQIKEYQYLKTSEETIVILHVKFLFPLHSYLYFLVLYKSITQLSICFIFLSPQSALMQ